MNNIVISDLSNLSKREIDFKKLKDKSIFIIGINSLIGRYFTLYLLYINKEKNLNLNIVGTARNIKKAENYFKDYIEQDNFTIISQDVNDTINYDGEVDFIIHSAGYASAYHIVNNPVDIIKANTIGTINVLEFAKEKNVENILFTSTREVYGKVGNVKTIDENCIGEMDHINPRNCYPESKKMSENLFISYNKQYNIPYTILRIAHTYGPTMELSNDGRVMADFLYYVVNNQNIVLKSEGTAVRSFCYITDTIYGMILALLNGKNEIYNLSNETEPYEIRDVAKIIIEENGQENLSIDFQIQNIDSSKSGYNKIPVVPMNTTKIEKLGWYPQVKLRTGIKNTIEYFKAEGEYK